MKKGPIWGLSRTNSNNGLWLDENALPRTLFCGLDDHLFLSDGHDGEALGPFNAAFGRGKDFVAFLDVSESIIQQHENIRGDFFAEAVPCAEILIDPNLCLLYTSDAADDLT